MRATTLLVVFCLGAAAATPVHQFNWRIVGGTAAAPQEHPFIISLRRLSGAHNCGGSIISDQWVLTAGHCVSGTSASSLVLFAGMNQLDDPEAVQLLVSSVIVHPGYNPWTIENDIALLKLTEPVELSDRIQPVQLQNRNFNNERNVTVIGWGRTGVSSAIPNDLQFLVSKTIPIGDCRSSWSAAQPVFDTEICTLTKVGEGACYGDSGGPLICDDPRGDGRLCGLVSWGSPCAVGRPDVFTRVYSYYDWIQETIATE